MKTGSTLALLAKLGYRVKNGAYRHPEGRVALFLGDLIDRGPGQIEVINIVRNMIEAGSGRTIMGNHEFNAIGYATKSLDGDGYMRRHNPNTRSQHKAFLSQIGWKSELHKELVTWFKTLPLFLDLGDIRLCHAWWNQEHIDLATRNNKPDGSLQESFLLSSLEKGSDANKAVEAVTKGMETDLPEGYSFLDHTGIERTEIRVRWWDESATTYRMAAMGPGHDYARIPDVTLPESLKLGSDGNVPTFLGHYWLTGTPSIQNPKIAILDYGAGIDGQLVAYRWDGESELTNSAFVAVG